MIILTPTARVLGTTALNVTFERLDEKSRGAYMYQVLVNGIVIGTLYKTYREGFRGGRGKLGGSAQGKLVWEFYSEEYEAYVDRVDDFLNGRLAASVQLPFFTWGTDNTKLVEAKKDIEMGLYKPLTRLHRLSEHAMEVDFQGIHIFLNWLAEKGVVAQAS